MSLKDSVADSNPVIVWPRPKWTRMWAYVPNVMAAFRM